MRFLDTRIHLTTGERLIASPTTPIPRELFPTDQPSPMVRQIDADHVAIGIAALKDGAYVANDAGHAARIEVRRGRIFRFDPAPANGAARGATGRCTGLPGSSARAA